MEFGIIEILKEARKSQVPAVINGIITIGQNEKCTDLDLITHAILCINTFTQKDIEELPQDKKELFFDSCIKLTKRCSKITGDKINELKENKPKEKSFDEMSKEELIAYIKNKH